MDGPVAEVWRFERRMRASNRQATPIPHPRASMNPVTGGCNVRARANSWPSDYGSEGWEFESFRERG